MRPGVDHEPHRFAAHLAIDVNVVALDVELERLVAAQLEHFLDCERGKLGVVEQVVLKLGPFADELLIGFAKQPDRLVERPPVLQCERDRAGRFSGDHSVKRLSIVQREPAKGGCLLTKDGSGQGG